MKEHHAEQDAVDRLNEYLRRNHKAQGTVQGQAICRRKTCEEFQEWLSHVGSPQSTIEKAEFSSMKESEIKQLVRELQESPDSADDNPHRLIFEVRKTKKR